MKGVQSAVRQALSKKDNVDDADRKPSGAGRGDSSDDDEGTFEASMRKKVLEKRARLSESKGAGGSNKKKGKYEPFQVFYQRTLGWKHHCTTQNL